MSAERPAVVVEDTGDPAAIERALEQVDELGTVVLAAPISRPEVMIDLYADLHVRGLTLVTAPPDDG